MMRKSSIFRRFGLSRFSSDRRGVAAAEFALIAPALIFLIMGVFEMTFRFRASEEATRYAHEVADMVARETELTTDDLNQLFKASVQMMKPLDTTDDLDLDVTSIGLTGVNADPSVLWRRVAGTAITTDIQDAKGMGADGESVIRVSVRYSYHSVLTELFGGSFMAMEKTAYSRPRLDKKVSLDGVPTDGGATTYLTIT
jgi:Flp pilus assembly protein TadG